MRSHCYENLISINDHLLICLIEDISVELNIRVSSAENAVAAALAKTTLTLLKEPVVIACIRENEQAEFEFMLKDDQTRVLQQWTTREQLTEQMFGK